MSKLFILLFCFIIFNEKSFSQTIKNQNYSSIKKAEDLVNQSEDLYLSGDYDTIIPICLEALRILNTIKPYNKAQVKSYYLVKSRALNNIGAIYYEKGIYEKSSKYYYKALRIIEKINDSLGLIETYNNIGLIYKWQSDTINARKFFRKSLRIAEQKNNPTLISRELNNLGGICSVERSDLAIHYYLKSLDIEQRLNRVQEIGKRQHNIAVAYQNIGDLENANNWYLKSIQTKKQINDLIGVSNTLIALSSLNLERNQIKKAEEFAKESKKIAKSLNYLGNIILSSEKLFEIYQEKKDYKNAIQELIELTKNKEQQIIDANEAGTVKLQMQYNFDKKIAEDSLKTKLERESLNLKIKVEKEKQYALYVFIFLTACFSVLMYNRFKKTKKQKHIIEEQKHLVENKNKEITDSITYAKRIQHTLLANDELLRKNLSDYFVLFKPKDIVSGDFYWASEQDNDFYIASCDSTGHGVPGAFMSLLNISFLNEAVNEKTILEPNEILNYVRKRLIDNIGQDGGQDGMDGTLVRINKQTKEITYASAYNSPILVSEKSIIYLSSNRMAVGKSPYEHKSFNLFKLDYKKNDVLYLYTDGFPDQFGGEKGKKFKLKQLQERLLVTNGVNLKNQGQLLEEIFNDWRGSFEQVDDVLVIGIKL